MMSQDEEMSIRQQAKLLGVSRSAFYYRQEPPDPMNLYIKRLIDEVHIRHPEFGSRKIGLWLKQKHSLNNKRKAIQRHMREMGIKAVYPRPNTSKPNPENLPVSAKKSGQYTPKSGLEYRHHLYPNSAIIFVSSCHY